MLGSQIFYNPETDEILEFMPTLITTKVIPQTSTVIVEDGFAIFSEKEPEATNTKVLREDVAIKYPHLVYLDSITIERITDRI